MQKNPEVSIFLIDDDDVDIIMYNRLFNKHGLTNPVVRAKDVFEAISILNGENEQIVLQKPYLIMLDINIPKMSGIDFLSFLRRSEKHKNAIVFVITTSQSETDRLKAYDYNISGYIPKEKIYIDTNEFVNLIKSYVKIVDFPD